MIRGRICKALFFASIAAEISAAAMPVQAGSTRPGPAGTGFPQYTYETDANRLCKGDTVVWGSSANKGIYYVKGAGPQRNAGFYACMADVKKAGYKIGE